MKELGMDDDPADGLDDGDDDELEQGGKTLTFDEPSDGDDGDEGDEPDPNDPFDPGHGREPPERVSHTRDRREPEPRRPLPRRSEVKADKRGNLIDKDGKIVARAGREARFYQGREKAKRDLSRAQVETTQVRDQLRKLAGAARQLYTQVENRKAADAKLQELGMTPAEQLQAANLFVEIRDNPVNGIKRILARAAANGVDLTQLGQGGNLGADPKALADVVKQIIGKELEPIRKHTETQADREKEQQHQQQIHDDAAAEVQAFFSRNPDARQYAPVFKRVLDNPNFAGMSLGEIYAKILQHPNLTRGNPRQRSRTPNGMPRGRGAAPSGNSKYAPPNTSYDDIINQSLNEASAGSTR